MVDITPLITRDRQVIQSYKNGAFRISGQIYEGAVLVLPATAHLWHGVKTPQHLTIDDFSPLLNHEDGLDLILLGAGNMITPVAPAVQDNLLRSGIALDIMNTGAACRTYNLLMAEGRRVAAALFPV